jgi:hypothetical protein
MEPTEWQRQALSSHIGRARARYGISAPPWRDGYPWATYWAEETRPGRGHDLTAVFLDGEHVLTIQLDVYGNGGGIAIGVVEWTHADADEDCDCMWCRAEREVS